MFSKLFHCTVVDVSKCQLCDKKLMIIEYESVAIPGCLHPDPILISCKSPECLEKANVAVANELMINQRYPLEKNKDKVTVQRTNGKMESDWQVGLNILKKEDSHDRDQWGVQVRKDNMVKCVDLKDFLKWNPKVKLSFMNIPHLMVPEDLLSLL